MAWNRATRPAWLRLTAAIGLVATAAGLRAGLLQFVGTRLPYVTFYPAVMLAALYGGSTAGLVATGLSAFLVAFFWMEPMGRLAITDPVDWVGLAIFVLGSTLLCLITETMHRAQVRANAAEAQAALSAQREREQEELRRLNETLKTLKESSEASAARLAGIVGSAMDAIITVDLGQRIVLFNAAAEKMFHCAASEAVGQALDRFIPSHYRERHREHVEAFGATGVTSRAMGALGALSAVRADGEQFPIEASISQAEVGGQKLFTVILRDITERRRAEEALRQANQELEERVEQRTAELAAASRNAQNTNALLALFTKNTSINDYLESVMDIIRQWSGCQAMGIRIVDENHEIPYQCWSGFDPAFIEQENRLQLQRDNCCCIRAISQSFQDPDRALLTPRGSYHCDDAIAFFNQLPPDQQARYRGNCMKFGFASLAVIPLRYHNEILGALHLADSRPSQFSASTIEFIEAIAPLIGEAVHRFQTEAELAEHRNQLEVLVKRRTSELITSNARLELEISERKRAQETLHQIALELQRSNSDLEQFAYVASHDLQEPLRAVGGYVKLLERRFPANMDPKALEYIAGAVDGATRMEHLITDLLAFSRVGTRPAGFARVDFDSLLDDALHNLELSLKEAQAHLTRDPLPSLPADPTQIMQLFQNLVGNALKFRQETPPRIHIAAQQKDRRWVISVSDNGIGIDPQYFERIFQIFQRLHTRKHYPGTGIGLAICKKIVERHGGSIWVESKPGQGSTFSFSIPQNPVIRDSKL